VDLPERLRVLTHCHRPFAPPLQSLSGVPATELQRVLADLLRHEALPYRLTQPGYLPERRMIEARMHGRFIEKGGQPQTQQPHYFVLGSFSLWEEDGSLQLKLPIDRVSSRWLSFTLTDSFFNYRRTNLRGIPIPARAYQDELFTLDELPAALAAHDLPTNDWRSVPERIFEVYVEAQLWSDAPVSHLLTGRKEGGCRP
jgi:hypothetical protein